MKKFLALLFVLALASAAFADVDIVGADSTGRGAAGQLFGEMVAAKAEEISGGSFLIDYHPNGDLGGDADLLRQAKDGDIAIVVCQTAPVVSFIPEMAVFDLPMAFARFDAATIDKVLNGDNAFTAALQAAYEKAGYHLLGFLQSATFRLTTANKDISKLEDFKGLKIRTMENSNHMKFWTAIGAEPTPLAFAELYFALQTGTVDAQENAADTCAAQSYNEVQKVIACTNHILYANQILIHKGTWDGFSDEEKAVLTQAVKESLAAMAPQLEKMDKDNKKILTDKGMTLIEYAPEFYLNIIQSNAVKDLYEDIDKQVNGLGTLLIKSLEDEATK